MSSTGPRGVFLLTMSCSKDGWCLFVSHESSLRAHVESSEAVTLFPSPPLMGGARQDHVSLREMW